MKFYFHEISAIKYFILLTLLLSTHNWCHASEYPEWLTVVIAKREISALVEQHLFIARESQTLLFADDEPATLKEVDFIRFKPYPLNIGDLQGGYMIGTKKNDHSSIVFNFGFGGVNIKPDDSMYDWLKNSNTPDASWYDMTLDTPRSDIEIDYNPQIGLSYAAQAGRKFNKETGNAGISATYFIEPYAAVLKIGVSCGISQEVPFSKPPEVSKDDMDTGGADISQLETLRKICPSPKHIALFSDEKKLLRAFFLLGLDIRDLILKKIHDQKIPVNQNRIDALTSNRINEGKPPGAPDIAHDLAPLLQKKSEQPANTGNTDTPPQKEPQSPPAPSLELKQTKSPADPMPEKQNDANGYSSSTAIISLLIACAVILLALLYIRQKKTPKF